MANKKTLTIAIMNAPYESARSTTAFRLIDIAVRRGYDVNVFAYEGAVSVPFALQKPHANAVHGRAVDEANHPLPKDWFAALLKEEAENGGKLAGVKCGLGGAVSGVGHAVEGGRR